MNRKNVNYYSSIKFYLNFLCQTFNPVSETAVGVATSPPTQRRNHTTTIVANRTQKTFKAPLK